MKVFILVLCLMLIGGVAAGQTAEAKLLGKFSGGDISEFNYRMVQTVVESNRSERLVLRICSRTGDLAEAISLSAGLSATNDATAGIMASLKRFGNADRSVSYAVSPNCSSNAGGFKTVEYWLVPANAGDPFGDEVPLNKIQVRNIRPETEEQFETAIQSFKKASGPPGTDVYRVAVGNYYQTPSAGMLNRIQSVSERIASEGACISWRFAFIKSSTGTENEPEPEFPVFVTVSIKDRRSGDDEATTCEEGRRSIDNALYEIKDDADQYLIVVLRPGNKESSDRAATRGRIIENLCSARGWAEKCVVAQQHKAEAGLGSGKLYLKGKLYATILYGKNESSFCIEQTP